MPTRDSQHGAGDAHWWDRHPVAAGTYCGIFSAVAYTGANVCLRAVTHCDPVWVSCLKALPTVILIGPFLLVRMLRSQALVPSLRLLMVVVGAGLFAQLFGNVVFQWALGVVGIALTVPLTLGTMIASSALLGRAWLGEEVTLRTALALLVLVAAICVLSFGAPEANRAIAATSAATASGGTLLLVLGVFAGCFAGFSYCLLGVAIRYTSARGLPLSTILVSTTLTGFLVLGALSIARLGLPALRSTAMPDLAVMLAAGVFNAVAYLALAKALHLTGVVFVNALNASQTAMAALVGIAFFHEPATVPLLAGIGLTSWGLLMMRRNHVASEKARRDADTRAAASLDDEPLHEISTVASDVTHPG